MPTVPTFTDLPAVQDQRPEIAPQKDISGFQIRRLEAAGEGAEQLGQGIDRAAGDVSRIGDRMMAQQNEVASKAATVAHQQTVNNLGFVDLGTTPGKPDGGYYSLKGQAAVNARPAYLAAVAASQAQNGQGLSNNASVAYNNQTQEELVREQQRALAYGITQGQDAAATMSTARAQSAVDQGVQHYNDADEIAASAQIIHSEAADWARIKGLQPNADGSPNIAQTQYEAQHLSPMYRGVVEKHLQAGDIQGASDAFERYGPGMTPVDNVEVQRSLRPQLLKMHAQQDGDYLIGPQPGAGSAPYNGGDYYDRVHGGEGNGVNAVTGAAGPVQVTPGTLADFRAAGHNEDVNTEAGARAFTAWDGQRNAATISAATGKPATNDQVVIAHLLGGGGAAAILSHPDDPISKHLSADAIANNKGPLPGGPNMTGAEAAQSIANYYAKARGESPGVFAGPGAPPTAAEVAAQKPSRPDFEGAYASVPLLPDDPERQEATRAYIRQRANAYDTGEAAEKNSLFRAGGAVDQTVTALANGAMETTVPELAIRRALPATEADAVMQKIADARSEGNLTNSVRYMAPADLAAQATALRAKLASGGTDAAENAQTVKDLGMLQTVMAKRTEALKADPWTYVRQEPSVAAAYSKDMSDPANVAAAVQRSEAIQARLGATPQSISTAGLQANAAQIHQAPVEAVPGIMAGLRKQYGAAWPDVFRDLSDPQKGKLDPLYQPFATMPQGGAGPIDYAAALRAKDEKGGDFGKTIPGADKATMETDLTSALSDYRNSFQPGTGNALADGSLNAARILATYRLERGGMNASQAAKSAVSDILGAVDVQDGIRAPKTMPDGSPMSAQKVLDAGQGVMSRLTEDQLLPQGLRGSVTLRQAQAGTWWTNPDGMSASLLVNNAVTGGKQFVFGKDQKPITIDYRRLPEAGGTPVPGAMADPAALGMQQ